MMHANIFSKVSSILLRNLGNKGLRVGVTIVNNPTAESVLQTAQDAAITTVADDQMVTANQRISRLFTEELRSYTAVDGNTRVSTQLQILLFEDKPRVHSASCRLNHKSHQVQAKLRMRIANLLQVVTLTALLATGNALSTDVDTGIRRLRSVDNTDAQDEERVSFNFSLLDDVFHRLPEQFQNMRSQPAYREYIFESWRQGLIDWDRAVAFMKKEGLTEKAVEQFLAAYKEYIKTHPFF